MKTPIGSACIYIVDHESQSANALRQQLAPLERTVHAFATVSAFSQAVPISAHGCLFIHYQPFDLQSVEQLEQLRHTGYTLPMVLTTADQNASWISRVIKLGVLDMLATPWDSKQAVELARLTLQQLEQFATQACAAEEFKQQVKVLSLEELPVLRGLILGRTNAEMAKLLDISLRTIQSRRASILEKMNVTQRSELVERAWLGQWNPRES